ncbi:hypothetical protein F442_10156, partial [Phytophthora nicotianae P10297]
RDDPAPLVDRVDNLRHIVDRILEDENPPAIPTASRTARDTHRHDAVIPTKRRYLGALAGPRAARSPARFFSPTFRTA